MGQVDVTLPSLKSSELKVAAGLERPFWVDNQHPFPCSIQDPIVDARQSVPILEPAIGFEHVQSAAPRSLDRRQRIQHFLRHLTDQLPLALDLFHRSTHFFV